MKVGDMVTTHPRIALGVIVDSHEMAATRRADHGKNTHCHHVYWSTPVEGPNPIWVMEQDLVRAI
jgi:hypothetical protein